LALILFCSFSALQAESTLNFPRLSFDPTTFTGIAIVNPTDEDATVTLTAYGEDGTPVAGVTNPTEILVAANQQFADVTSSLFVGQIDPATIAWFQATSPVDGLTGFFLFLNSPPTTQFDGADLPVPATRMVFPQVLLNSGYTTELNLINPNLATATLELKLIGANPTATQSLSLPSLGVARLDVAELFSTVSLDSDAYVTISSNLAVSGFELVRSPDGDLVGLNARSGTEQLTQLYFPQVAVLGPFGTSVGVINNASSAVILTFSVFQPDGSLYDTQNLLNNPVTRNLTSGEILVEDLVSLFGFSGENLLDGWLQVESSSPAVTGFLTYGTPSTGSAATVTPSRLGQNRAIFSHLETSQGFFTGLAVLNPGQLAANVQTVVLTKTGELVGNSSTVLQPGQRFSQLIDQLVPEAQGQSGGLIFLKSDVPVYASSLFGSNDGQVLANIPPQLAPVGFDPGGTPLEITPALAVVQPNQTWNFQVVGEVENAIWKVNGFEGGTATLGEISMDGTYMAPVQVPSPRVVTVSAEVDNQTAAASVDVLEKETLLTSSLIVQSVVYLSSLEKLYTAELEIISFSGEGPQPADQRPTQTFIDSTIFEVAPGGVKTSLGFFGEISQMISYTATNGKEFLLLTEKDSGSFNDGRVYRLDPTTGDRFVIVFDLDQPEAMVIDPVTGDLLVAEQDKITTVPQADLGFGLDLAARMPGSRSNNQVAELFSAPGTGGISVDQCTSNVYISNPTTGEILRFIRSSGELELVFSGLDQPTRLLAFYREGVSCPDAFHLLVIERGTDQILLTLPVRNAVTPWIPAQESRDISFLPGGSPFVADEAVLFSETVAEQGTVSAVTTPELYDEEPDNPPREVSEVLPDCVGTATFSDANLEAVVRDALGIDQITDITCEQAQGLTELRLFLGEGITNLNGLDFFTNLRRIFLSGNTISDLTPLASLPQLTFLELYDNSISNLSPLAGLTQLTTLILGLNSISDLTPLAELTQLTELRLDENLISDITPLAGLTQLTFLELGGTSISNLSPLAGLTQLDSLGLGGNSISDITPLAGLTQLTFLELGGTSISNLSPLAGLTQLDSLGLGGNSISDITPLTGLTQLADLRLYGNSISDITSLAGLTQLNFLDLESNSLSDLAPLVGLTQLADLRLYGNSISDITPLAGLTQLTSLGLVLNSISDITSLSGLTQLHTLLLESNSISDITPLAGLTQLTLLYLDSNSISDIASMVGLTQLNALGLDHNSISDIIPLAGLTQLRSLNLRENSIRDITPLAGLTQLDTLDLRENSISDITSLQGLTQLINLLLESNSISDITPLIANAGLGAGDSIFLADNPLDAGDCTDIQTLIDRGANVFSSVSCP
jgi:internalin A